MQLPEPSTGQRHTPPDRLSRLAAASLRINESLELDAVLEGVLDSAVELAQARYGVIALLDPAGQVAEVLSAGLSQAEAEVLWRSPHGESFFEHLRALAEPMRVADLVQFLRARGLQPPQPPLSVHASLAAPIRHRDEQIGVIHLAQAEPGREFSREDEDTLVLFAAQAALVIANARRHRAERQARIDLETLVDTSPVGVLLLDVERGRVASLNREATRLFGGLLAENGNWERTLGTFTYRRTDGLEIPLEELSFYEALRTGESVRAEEISIELPDGRTVTVLVNATPIQAASGQSESFVVTLQDLAPLEDVERMRAEFLGMVSHELRTPLTSIRGSANALMEGELTMDPAERRQFHRIIVEQSDHMRGLINNLLDIARIETGTLSVATEATEVAAIIDDACKTFQRAGGRNELDVDLDPDLPLVVADRRRIAQVLGNLLSNAARSSDAAWPIALAAHRDGLQVAVSVSNRGWGIAVDALPQLFRKHARWGGEPAGRELSGSGLGLAICKGIVEAHGGRIWAESDGLDQGARFTFTLPAIETAQPGDAGSGAPARRRSGRQTTVLAVDDDPMALRYIRDALSRAGYTPVVTADPDDVPRLMAEELPELVLMDMMLPEHDGIQLMQRILATSDVPVIFVSAYGQEENVTRALDMGAADYVVKPFAPSELAARIRAALRQRTGLSRAAQPRPYVRDELTIDFAERRVTLAGHALELTPTEYAVLYELAAQAGMVLTHEQLLVRVWGPGRVGDSGLVRTIVRRLRAKLGDDAGAPRYIFTEPRVGYRLPTGESE